MTLLDLKNGETGIISQSPSIQRLSDLGFIRGKEVTRLFASSFGDPISFRVLGAVIALRKAEASTIQIDGM